LPEEQLKAPLKPCLRLATAEDLAHYETNCRKERRHSDCQRKNCGPRPDHETGPAEYTFDNGKSFLLTSDSRIDFRELVKDLAAIFRTRIELRQIGVRDEARLVGGLGICGRVLCCCSFLDDFVPVSIKMAKEQNLSMNPAKISGACGRLMCCLKYEQDAYEDAHSRMPRPGHQVQTAEGPGVVEAVNLLRETVTVRLDRGGEADLITLPYTEVEIIGGKPTKKSGGGAAKSKPAGSPGRPASGGH
jgi:cell fate regulator YaaT (PSP1 superfamily)